MTQNKLTPDELAMLDEYIEYGEQNSFEYIAVQKVYEALRITKAQAQKIKESDEYIELKRAISKFDDKRKFGFGTFQNFYKWYKKEPQECYYCHIKQDELDELWSKELISSKANKFSATLHIERLNSNEPYSRDNCRLACAVCNNAKSDMISEQDFRECFVEGIKKFYNLLKSRL